MKNRIIIIAAGFVLSNSVLLCQCNELHSAIIHAPLKVANSIYNGTFKYYESINTKDDYNNTPLHYAVKVNSPFLIKALIKSGSDVNVKNVKGETIFHVAAYCSFTWIGDINMIKLLVANKYDIHSIDKRGFTPLHCAAKGGHASTVKFLIKMGADINAADNHGWRPLHDAARAGHTDILKILINAGANINVKTYDGRTFEDMYNEYLSKKQ